MNKLALEPFLASPVRSSARRNVEFCVEKRLGTLPVGIFCVRILSLKYMNQKEKQ